MKLVDANFVLCLFHLMDYTVVDEVLDGLGTGPPDGDVNGGGIDDFTFPALSSSFLLVVV